MSRNSRRRFLAAAGVLLAAPALAQAPRKYTIGIFGDPEGGSRESYVLFRKTLRELGYVEGKNLQIEFRSGRSPDAIAAEYVRMKVDLMVAGATVHATAAKRATGSIPILTQSGDPIEAGLTGSLARPTANVTGVTTVATGVIGKQLQFLKEIAPQFNRVAILWNPENRYHGAQVKEAEAMVRSMGAQPVAVAVRGPGQLEAAFDEMSKARVDALLKLADGALFIPNMRKIVQLAAARRIPAMYPRKEEVLLGGLMSYGTDRVEGYRRLAIYADRLLKGAKPADLPIEQADRFALLINRGTAKALGIRIPQEILGRADQVID